MTQNLIIARSPHFKSAYKKQTTPQQEAIDETIKKIISYKQTRTAPYGLRIKQLRPKIYEGRHNISIRIIFFSHQNTLRFITLGNHNDILRALKQIDQLNH